MVRGVNGLKEDSSVAVTGAHGQQLQSAWRPRILLDAQDKSPLSFMWFFILGQGVGCG